MSALPSQIEAGPRPSTLGLLEKLQPTWSGLHNRYLKSMVLVRAFTGEDKRVCGDTYLELGFQTCNNRMDELLERYFGELNSHKFAAITETEDGRGTQ